MTLSSFKVVAAATSWAAIPRSCTERSSASPSPYQDKPACTRATTYGPVTVSTLDEELKENPYLQHPTLDALRVPRMEGKTPGTPLPEPYDVCFCRARVKPVVTYWTVLIAIVTRIAPPSNWSTIIGG